MTAGGRIAHQLQYAKTNLSGLKGTVGKLGKTALAGVAGAGLLAFNAGKSLFEGAARLKDNALTPKKSREVIEVKKTTFIALLVALAAVAGVLGALYFYVLRRERELDEYEQLLFSEDFNDDLLDEDTDDAGE